MTVRMDAGSVREQEQEQMMGHPKTVLAALSGGVDSSVAALLAQRAGCRVIGATLDLTPPDPALRNAWSCGSADQHGIIDALVRKLGMEHHYLSVYDRFEREVLRPCAELYAAGRTPNPCCRCNPRLKFGVLLELADQLGADALLTGHYAGLTPDHGDLLLRRGTDRAKDQSYFLYALPRAMLPRLYFPLAGLTKPEVRRIAVEAGLPAAEQRDSQDACFHFPGESFAETLHRIFALSSRPGSFRYQGRTVGRHGGIHAFTLGQRKGLGVALGRPAFIRSIDAETGSVELVTDETLLAARRFTIADANWHTAALPLEEPLLIQIRYRTPPAPGVLHRLPNGTLLAELAAPQRAITPGQAAVFYRDDLLLGGGIIHTVLPPA